MPGPGWPPGKGCEALLPWQLRPARAAPLSSSTTPVVASCQAPPGSAGAAREGWRLAG